ncbi:MAG: OpcA/G6PD domain-containing protein, partial [Acidobacteriota bacterium]
RECSAGLLELADKVIIDSQGWPQTRDKIRAIRRGAESRIIADLEWTRLTRWRQMLAQEFDNPAYLSRLAELESATVTFDGQFIPMRALFMGGWLRSVLDPKVAISLRSSGTAAGPRLRTVALHGGSLHFEMNVEPTRASEMTMCNQTAHPAMPALDEYELMREELSITGHDAAFEKSLPYAEENAQ